MFYYLVDSFHFILRNNNNKSIEKSTLLIIIIISLWPFAFRLLFIERTAVWEFIWCSLWYFAFVLNEEIENEKEKWIVVLGNWVSLLEYGKIVSKTNQLAECLWWISKLSIRYRRVEKVNVCTKRLTEALRTKTNEWNFTLTKTVTYLWNHNLAVVVLLLKRSCINNKLSTKRRERKRVIFGGSYGVPHTHTHFALSVSVQIILV